MSSVDDDLTPRPSLPGDLDVDVAIVGAGYTGLWTAYYLARADPSLRIAVLEAEIAGYGASGRDGAGGWPCPGPGRPGRGRPGATAAGFRPCSPSPRPRSPAGTANRRRPPCTKPWCPQ